MNIGTVWEGFNEIFLFHFFGEPHRNRTCNLLIKRDTSQEQLNNLQGNLESNSQLWNFIKHLVYYLVPYGILKFVGKMLAKLLLFIESIFQQRTD